MSDDFQLISRARSGDGQAFEALVAPHLAALHALARRMTLQPEDARDLVQDALLKAHGSLDTFRGESPFRSWLLSIVARRCIDHVRARRRWPVLAQTQVASEHAGSTELMADLRSAAAAPDFEFDYREHVTYCFSCVARSLEPEDAAALLLHDVLELSNDETAAAIGVTNSVARHRMSAARRVMTETYDGLCALVGKGGACWQCSVLRDALPSGKRGRPVQPLCGPQATDDERYRARVAMVRDAQFGSGAEKTRRLHEYITRYMARTFD